MKRRSIPSINAWTRAGVTAIAGVSARLHDDTAAKVPDSSRFMHSQKPPSSQISTFNFRRSLLRKRKPSPVYGSWPSSCSTTHANRSMPRRMSWGSRATKIRRTDEKLSTGSSAKPKPQPAVVAPGRREPPP